FWALKSRPTGTVGGCRSGLPARVYESATDRVDGRGGARGLVRTSRRGDVPTRTTAVMLSPCKCSDEFRVQRNFGVQNLGNRAILFGVLGQFGEFRFVKVRHLGTQSQSRAADLEAFAFRLERNRGLGGELGGSKAGSLHPECESHGEATSVRRGDELFGVGAFLVFEPGPERIRCIHEDAGLRGKIATARATRATPNRFRLADHGNLRWFSPATIAA